MSWVMDAVLIYFSQMAWERLTKDNTAVTGLTFQLCLSIIISDTQCEFGYLQELALNKLMSQRSEKLHISISLHSYFIIQSP